MEDYNFKTPDTVFAFAMLACGFLYWNLIDLARLGAGVTVFAVVLFAASLAYLAKSGIRQNKGSAICLVLAGLSAAQFALFDNQFVQWLNFMYITVLFIYWVCLSTGRRIDKTLSVYIVGDAVKQGLIVPFMNFGRCGAGIKAGFSDHKKGKGVLAAALGVLIFLPVIILVLKLLMSADLAFESFAGKLYEMVRIEEVLTYVGQFVLGIPVAFYLYGLVYGDVKGRHTGTITVSSVDSAAETARIAPRITIYSALASFCLVYLVFFAVQAAYLFSALGGRLPEAFTYAEYARRGFFELCAVAGINLAVLTVCHIAVKREKGEEPKALRIETATVSLFTILLIVTALSKMAMYIDAYGLTQLRVFTSWFMVLLLFVFLTICVRQFKKFNSARLMIAGFALMFTILSYGNADGLIAKYNIQRYEAGTLKTLDVYDLRGLSDAAVPYIYDFYTKTDEGDDALREGLAYAIMDKNDFGGTGFRSFNLQRQRAEEIRKKMPQ
ncbi:MAG: DUF4173 domain-containing protein [Clostridiales bacterium]|nr:DUF4173 domain-containing protein [Clostridiales bacterium]